MAPAITQRCKHRTTPTPAPRGRTRARYRFPPPLTLHRLVLALLRERRPQSSGAWRVFKQEGLVVPASQHEVAETERTDTGSRGECAEVRDFPSPASAVNSSMQGLRVWRNSTHAMAENKRGNSADSIVHECVPPLKGHTHTRKPRARARNAGLLWLPLAHGKRRLHRAPDKRLKDS